MKDKDDLLLEVVLMFNGGPLGAKQQNGGSYSIFYINVNKVRLQKTLLKTF